MSVREMKEVVKGMPEARGCIERADLESLVASTFPSMEAYQSKLQDQTKLESLRSRIQKVLSQDRGVLNFEHYTPGDEHLERMKKLKQVAPELYDNPSITPRSKWFQHPRYRQNSQMPPYHIHFRHEMQEALSSLYEAYHTEDPAKQRQYIRRASSTFHGSMRGLNGHVSIEEYACFPTYKHLHPHVDIRFLYDDHKHLHEEENAVSTALARLVEAQQSESFSRDQILNTLEVFLAFDDVLMAHLGEEEEIVVPMSLTDKPVHF